MYGRMVPTYLKVNKIKSQHKGVGSALLKMAEKKALDERCDKIAVISGVGVRGFYRKKGYNLKGAFMIKTLDADNYYYPLTFKLYLQMSVTFYLIFLAVKVYVRYNKIDLFY